MARNMEEQQSIRVHGSRKRRNRRIRIYAFSALLLILVVAGAIYIFKLYHRSYTNFEVSGSTPNTEENLVGYLPYNGSAVRYGLDGAIAYDKKGKLLWNGAYEMQDPIADVCEKYVVIGDRGNKALLVYDEDGEAASFKMEHNIIKVAVASQGVTAVLMGDKESHYIKMFDLEGTVLVDNKYDISKDGYPLDIDLSEDGKKLATVLMSINQGKLTNKVAFYNYGEVGQNLRDRLAGAFLPNDEEAIIPRITFLDNDTAVAYKDSGFILYKYPEYPEFIMEETVEGKIKSILHNSKYIGLVEEGENGASQLLLYDLEGKKLLDKKLELKYNNIFLSGEEIILYDNVSCQILRADGKEKFSYTFTTNISALYPINHLDRYLFISAEEVSEIKLLE